jgi:plasmid stabilization system protein ParE
MVVELIWSPLARKDLLDIYILIGLENPAAAERLYTTIEAKAVAIADYPRLGGGALIFAPPRGCWSKGRTSFFLKRTPTLTRGQSIGSRSSASWTAVAI